MGKFKEISIQNGEGKGLNVYEEALNVAMRALHELR